MLVNGIAREWWGTDEITEDEVQAWFRHGEIDAFVAERDRELVGYGDRWCSKDRDRLQYELHATEREAGTALVRQLEAAPALAPGARAKVGISDRDDVLRPVLEDAGYALVRHGFRMAVELDDAVPAELPEWVELRTYEPEHEAAVHATHQEAFADRVDPTPLTLDEWRSWFVESPGFDPSFWFLAWQGSELAGISLCQADTSHEAHGHVNVLAVRRPWRQRGLGAALLSHSFEEMKRRGMTRATLGVDADNPTGAVRLYERVGMHVERRHDVYRKELS